MRDGAQLPLSGYTEDVPWRPGAFTGLALPDRVADEHARGATLVLQALHLHWRPAALYCRGLEQRLGFPVQANAYLTPASAQGFAVHHDTHDVFVLQVSGSKRWRIYAPLLELPLKHQRWSPALGDPGEPVQDVTLRPGDTLYVPRGWPHEAVTDRADSLHLTIGLHPPTRLDALRAALDACRDDVEFRRTLDRSGELPADLLERLAARLAPADVAAPRAPALRRRPPRRCSTGSSPRRAPPPSSAPATPSSGARPSSPPSTAPCWCSTARSCACPHGPPARSPPPTTPTARSPPPTCRARSTRPAGSCSSAASSGRGFCV